MTARDPSKPHRHARPLTADRAPRRERHPVPSPATGDEDAPLAPWVDVAARKADERGNGVVDDWPTIEPAIGPSPDRPDDVRD
jgi:hypothetical protein